jgi:hypothetical protein
MGKMSETQIAAGKFWDAVKKSPNPVQSNQRERGSGISTFAFVGLMALDKSLIGTYDYMGRAYFWHYKYRHYLRDASQSKRRRVHKMMLDAGLDVLGETESHDKIIEKVFSR